MTNQNNIYERARSFRLAQLDALNVNNEPRTFQTEAERIREATVEQISNWGLSTGQNGYADAQNSMIVAARDALEAQRREQALEVANRHSIPAWDTHALEMRDTIRKLVGAR